MSSEILLIERGAIETRAALIRDGAPVRFWFGPAPGDECADMRPVAGRRFVGRVRHVDRALNAAFIDIGGETDAFLSLRKSGLIEGASVCVRIVAAPRRGKGAVVELIEVLDKAQPVGRFEALPSPIEASEAIGADAAEIVTDSAEIARLLQSHAVSARISTAQEDAGVFAAYDVEDALEMALEETVALPGGGALHFSETEALAAIDVDTGAVGASSPDRLREKVIEAAAQEAVLQIERRNLSGRIIIDFPSIRSRERRRRAVQHIERALAGLSRITSHSIAGSNLVTLTRERLGASLWDETTEAVPSTPVAGRRFTRSWLARRAIYAVEKRQVMKPSARLELRVGVGLDTWLKKTTNVSDAYFQRWGTPLNLVCDKKLGEHDFDLVER